MLRSAECGLYSGTSADEAQQELAKLRAQIQALGIQPNQDNLES